MSDDSKEQLSQIIVSNSTIIDDVIKELEKWKDATKPLIKDITINLNVLGINRVGIMEKESTFKFDFRASSTREQCFEYNTRRLQEILSSDAIKKNPYKGDSMFVITEDFNKNN